MKDFTLKFIDIMIGIVLGLGFQWLRDLHEAWQYAIFAFAYLNIIDYWIDYVPALRKFPPKTELTLLIDVGLLFSMFLLIYSAQLTAAHFLAFFVVYRLLDLIWVFRVRSEYSLVPADKIYFDTWFRLESIEAFGTALLLVLTLFAPPAAVLSLTIFILFRIVTRILASFQYKKVHFA